MSLTVFLPVWQRVIGLQDFTVAWQLFYIEPPFFDTGNMGNVPLVIFAVGIIVHLLCIYLLVRYRRYYLATPIVRRWPSSRSGGLMAK